MLHAPPCGMKLPPHSPSSSHGPCRARVQGACHGARLLPLDTVTHTRQQAFSTLRTRPAKVPTGLHAVTMDDGSEYDSTATPTPGSSSPQLIYKRAVKGVEAIRQQHPHEGTSSQGGRVFEVHVEASFNLDAVRNNSPYRCVSCRDTSRRSCLYLGASTALRARRAGLRSFRPSGHLACSCVAYAHPSHVRKQQHTERLLRLYVPIRRPKCTFSPATVPLPCHAQTGRHHTSCRVFHAPPCMQTGADGLCTSHAYDATHPIVPIKPACTPPKLLESHSLPFSPAPSSVSVTH